MYDWVLLNVYSPLLFLPGTQFLLKILTGVSADMASRGFHSLGEGAKNIYRHQEDNTIRLVTGTHVFRRKSMEKQMTMRTSSNQQINEYAI